VSDDDGVDREDQRQDDGSAVDHADGDAVGTTGGHDGVDHVNAGDAAETADDEVDETAGIEERVERVEEIVERLESGDPGLAEAKRLRDEGKRLVAELRADLETDEGDVFELDDPE